MLLVENYYYIAFSSPIIIYIYYILLLNTSTVVVETITVLVISWKERMRRRVVNGKMNCNALQDCNAFADLTDDYNGNFFFSVNSFININPTHCRVEEGMFYYGELFDRQRMNSLYSTVAVRMNEQLIRKISFP